MFHPVPIPARPTPVDPARKSLGRAGRSGCRRPRLLSALLLLALAGCGGSGGDDSPPAHTLGGTIAGLTGPGLVLANGSDTVEIAADATRFTLAAAVDRGEPYAVSVQSQPSGQTCSVTGGSGTMGSADVADVVVNCIPRHYGVGGTISGLTEGGLVLANGSDTLSVPAGAATFTMDQAVAHGLAYQVTVDSDPHWQACSVTQGSGTIVAAAVTDVAVDCEDSVWVSTLAGTGEAGHVDGNADVARFQGPVAVALDAQGTLYVAEGPNHRIRKVTADGSVSTLAGSGTAGFADGPGASAQFQFPNGIAVGADGVVYVADALDHRIRKIAVDGTVSTLAGSGTLGFADGSGATARFFFPAGVAVDARGVVYVADSGDHRIRRIATDGTVSTLAGDGTDGHLDGVGTQARFSEPNALVVDRDGVVYVADAGNHRIRRIATDGTVSTLAGSGSAGFADGAGAAAQFDYPLGIALDGNGVLYVADTDNVRIRRITTDGMVSTLAGTGTTGHADGRGDAALFDGLSGLAVDPDGSRLYVADMDNDRLRRIGNAP